MASMAAEMFPRRVGRWLTLRLKIGEDCLNERSLKENRGEEFHFAHEKFANR
jgi:hypothetical protein